MFAKAKVAVFALAMGALTAATSSYTPAAAGPKTYLVALSGQSQVHSRKVTDLAGDSDGSGLVKLRVDLLHKQICYDFSVSHLATPLMAHIHRGRARHNGPSVVTLFTGPGAQLQDCLLWTEKWLAEIVSDPAGFYVNLSTTEYPDGALRGQLVG